MLKSCAVVPGSQYSGKLTWMFSFLGGSIVFSFFILAVLKIKILKSRLRSNLSTLPGLTARVVRLGVRKIYCYFCSVCRTGLTRQ